MELGFVITLLRRTILQIIIVSSPVLLAALITGLILSILQATTSIQDQTLTFVPKILVILLVLGLTGAWILGSLAGFTRNIFALISEMS